MQYIVLRDNHSDHFDLIEFPDGQKNIRLKLDLLNPKEYISIKCRIKNFAELEVLLCLYRALLKNDFMVIEIQYIYLYGMRSDRAFHHSEPNYFRDVLAPVLNSTRDASGSCVNQVLFYRHSKMNSQALANPDSDRYLDSLCHHLDFKDSLKLGADQSSFIDHPAFIKSRNGNEVIVHLNDKDVKKLEDTMQKYPNDQILICDDLCDGGATFIACARWLRERFPNMRRLALWVTHGLFTKGLEPLLEHFDHIYTTNSYQDIQHPKVTVIDVFQLPKKKDE